MEASASGVAAAMDAASDVQGHPCFVEAWSRKEIMAHVLSAGLAAVQLFRSSNGGLSNLLKLIILPLWGTLQGFYIDIG
jgi:hypothetical protein